MSDVLVRFAPSPTGLLHVGNVRTALVNWLYARAAGGRFLLRLDDTDDERSEARYAEAIERDLTWLGMDWDTFAKQSDRLDRYDAAAEKLKASGRLYPCWETPEELSLKRKAQLSAGRPPVYDRGALKLTEDEKAARLDAGEQPHWRFLLNHEEVRWDDLVRGEASHHMSSLSDPVLIRADGRPIYTLASVVDDAELGVTHILRGEDHVTNSAAQVQLFEALGAAVPAMGHLSLLAGADGEGLSKRLGSLSIESLREEGLEPMALTSLLAKIGTSDPIEVRPDMAALAAEFDIAKFGRATPRFDPAELRQMNAKLLHETGFDAVADRLSSAGIEGGAAFWNAVRGNLEVMADTELWWRVVKGPVEGEMRPEDAPVLDAAVEFLPDGPWTEDTWTPETWKAWTGAIREKTGVKGRDLFMPIRVALTGERHGPELRDLLSLIGRDEVLSRLMAGTGQ